MEETFSEEWKNFDRVWRRVCGAEEIPEPPGDEPAARLKTMIAREADAAAYYRSIARFTDGSRAETLRRFSGECRENVKRLQTELYLLTGEIMTPKPAALPPDGFLGYLRRAYLSEGAAARACLAAAAAPESEALRTLYGQLAAAHSDRQTAISRLVLSIMK